LSSKTDCLCIEEYGNNGTYAFQGKENGVRTSGANRIEGKHVGRRKRHQYKTELKIYNDYFNALDSVKRKGLAHAEGRMQGEVYGS